MAEQYAPRRAKAHEEFTTTGTDGGEISMKADKDGLVQPKSPEQQALADAFELPHARTGATESGAKAESGTASRPTTTSGPTAAKQADTAKEQPATVKGGTSTEEEARS